MKVEWEDVQWLRQHQPRLAVAMDSPMVVGMLDISAYYDRPTQRLFSGRRFAVGDRATFLAAQFVVDIELNAKDQNGWPKVYDIGKRYQSIAGQYHISDADLHFYPDGRACLGLTYPWDPPLTLRSFVAGLVEPFFYRLAYVDVYGLSAARADLWMEYSHGEAGLREHQQDVRRGMASQTAAGSTGAHFHLTHQSLGLINRNG